MNDAGLKDYGQSRILVADDDHLLTAVAAMALRSNGFEVDEAGDGAIALSYLERNDYDLVVLDLEMPNTSGFQVIEKTRADPRLKHVPIIVVTSRADPLAITKSYDLGATSFVVKPIKWNVLVHHIRYAIRTSQMAAELRSAKAEAEQASQLKGNLLSMIAHEFRTPIHAIDGFSRLIEHEINEPRKGEGLRGHLSEITQATARLNSILADILLVSKNANGTINLREDDYLVEDLLTDVISEIDQNQKTHHINIVPNDAVKSLELLCDREMCLRLACQTIGNAIKFSPQGSVITLSAMRSEEGDLVATVRDQGPGITDEELENVFQPFSQSDMSSTRLANGLGMGLTISKMICDAHGGSINIKRVPEGGTEVSLVFPAERVTQIPVRQIAEVA